MIDHDPELRKVLREWKAPEASARLDERIWKCFEEARPRVHRAKLLLPVAAGIVLVTGVSMHLMSAPHEREKQQVVSLKATMEAAGFEPLPDGAITVTKSGDKQ